MENARLLLFLAVRTALSHVHSLHFWLEGVFRLWKNQRKSRVARRPSKRHKWAPHEPILTIDGSKFSVGDAPYFDRSEFRQNDPRGGTRLPSLRVVFEV